MKSNLVLVLLLAVCVALGGFFYGHWRKSNADLAELRVQNEALVEQNLTMQEAVAAQGQIVDEEVARLKQENAELLRLRNEVRQLREERKTLGVQVQAAQQQVQQVQEQAQATEQRLAGQVQAAAAQAAQAVQGVSAAEAETFRRRYGITQAPNQESCINNLRQIDGAKQQWALENKKPGTSIPTAQDLAVYLRGAVLPTCPQGGTYTLHAANANPTCTLPGHALPN